MVKTWLKPEVVFHKTQKTLKAPASVVLKNKPRFWPTLLRTNQKIRIGFSESGYRYLTNNPDLVLATELIFVIDLQDANKKLIFLQSFSAYYFLKVHLHHFSKIKSQKDGKKNSRNQGLSYYFCMIIEGSGSGSGSIPLTNLSGSGWPENIRIRIRIRNTVSYKEKLRNFVLSVQSVMGSDIPKCIKRRQ
jgi:hypothetical protein